jgi:hypothetical protein
MLRVWVVAGLLAAAAGCGPGDAGGKVQVAGKVTFKGQPVALGRVYFDADQKKNPGGQSGYADIKDGRYDTAAEGKAPSAGAVNVRVEGLTPPGANGLHGLLFRQYEFAADLPAGKSDKDIDVPAAQGDKMPKGNDPPP